MKALSRAFRVLRLAVLCATIVVAELYGFAWLMRDASQAHVEEWASAVSLDTVEGFQRLLEDKNWASRSRTAVQVADPAALLQHQRAAAAPSEGVSAGSACRLFATFDRQGRRARPSGFVTRDGVPAVPDLQFDEVRPFSGSLAAGRRRDKWGFIDETGDVVVTPRFERVLDMSDGLAAVYGMGRCGYVDRGGRPAIAADFTRCSSFQGGRALVQKAAATPSEKPRTAIIDSSGAVTAELPSVVDWSDDPPFADGVASVRVGSGYVWVGSAEPLLESAYVTAHGTFVDGPSYFAAQRFSEGLAAVQIRDIKGAKSYYGYYSAYHSNWGYIDRTFRLVIPTIYAAAEPFGDGLARVFADDTYAFIDRAGQTKLRGAAAGSFFEGLASFTSGKKSGYMNIDGIAVIPALFDTAGPYCGGIARVEVNDELSGLVDRSGRLVWIDTWSESRWDVFLKRVTPTWWPTYTALRPGSQNRIAK